MGMTLAEIEKQIVEDFISEEAWECIQKALPIIGEEVLPAIHMDEKSFLEVFKLISVAEDEDINDDVEDLLGHNLSFGSIWWDDSEMEIVALRHNIQPDTLLTLMYYYLLEQAMKVAKNTNVRSESNEFKRVCC